MDIALEIVGLVLVFMTVLPLARTPTWWVRLCDFPRLQIAAAIAIVMAGIVWIGGVMAAPVLLLALAASLAWQIYRIVPYTPLMKRQALPGACGDDRRLRLLIANVLMTNRDAGAFLALVKATSPDMVLIAEGDHWWDKQLESLAASFSHAVRQPQDNTYGLHLFSRLALADIKLRFLVEDDVPSIYARVRLRSGHWIDFHGVHPRPPRVAQDSAKRDAELILVAREIKTAGRPTVVAGDLNDVAWSGTTNLFQRISGMLDPRVGRGLFATFNANWRLLRWPLDHVFHDPSFTVSEIRRLPYIGSDHFPMLIELCHRPGAARHQAAPPAEPGDHARASMRLQAGLDAARNEPSG